MGKTALSERVAGILLAGGSGTRMRPLTRDRNKHLLPVGMRPMIDYALGTLLNIGFSGIPVVTGRHIMGQIAVFLGARHELEDRTGLGEAQHVDGPAPSWRFPCLVLFRVVLKDRWRQQGRR